jgi:hypothetical protein
MTEAYVLYDGAQIVLRARCAHPMGSVASFLVTERQDCPHVTDCPMFSLFNLKSTLEIWKIRYCSSDNHTSCERYRLTERGQPVPQNLMPSGALLRKPT